MAWTLRRWRRERALRRGRIDDRLWEDAVERFPFTRCLTGYEKAMLREDVTLFLQQKAFSAAGGLEVTERMRVDLAVQACVLVLNLGLEWYDGWVEIILYPSEFLPEHTWVDEAGVVHHERGPMAGEAWLQGPVILSWEDVARAAEGDGVNVVIHEFAHKLDMRNGDANGFPPLHRDMSRQAWSGAFTAAYAHFCARVERGRWTDIDPYAAHSPGEFFAVLSEVFFEVPEVVADAYPAVYEQLRRFYRQDPLARQRETARIDRAGA
jgi:Mlc titration factor MtfA (ptsG expression regulator)